MTSTKCKAISVQLNYVDRIKQRYITINGNNGTVSIDLISNTAKFSDLDVKFSVNADDTYVAQHLAVISSDSQNTCSLSEALKVVETIQAIEKSAEKLKWISQ